MRLKHLEASLSSLQREFPSPKVDLEQYPTSPHLAACVIQMAMDCKDIGEERSCLDLGCGTGMLLAAAALVNTDFVIGIDCDEDALEVAQENLEQIKMEDSVELLKARVLTGKRQDGSERLSKLSPRPQKVRGGRGKGRGGGKGGRGRGGRGSQPAQMTKAALILDGSDGIPLHDNCVDTVLTNPPFGTKDNAGIDLQFLWTATRLASRAVYSFHKRSTRPFLLKTIREDWKYKDAKVVAEMAFDVPNMYRFHTQKSKDIEVDLIRISCIEKEAEEECCIEKEAEEECKEKTVDDIV